MKNFKIKFSVIKNSDNFIEEFEKYSLIRFHQDNLEINPFPFIENKNKKYIFYIEKNEDIISFYIFTNFFQDNNLTLIKFWKLPFDKINERYFYSNQDSGDIDFKYFKESNKNDVMKIFEKSERIIIPENFL